MRWKALILPAPENQGSAIPWRCCRRLRLSRSVGKEPEQFFGGSVKRFLWFSLLVFLGVALATAQTATVTRIVNLRPDPSTDNDPIEKLKPPAQIQLIEPDPTDGFYHVAAADGQNGWGWAKNVSVQQDGTPTNSGDSGGDGGAPADAISTDWEKPDP